MEIQKQLNTTIRAIKVETAPVISRATALEVVDAQSYADADSLLGRVIAARKTLKERLGAFLNPLADAVKSAQTALKEAKGFHEEAESPLVQAEMVIRDKMKQYMLDEAKNAARREQEREAEAEKLREEADKKRLAEMKAKTQAMKDRLAAQRAELETKADLATAAPVMITPKTAHSTSRRVLSPQVVNMTVFLRALLAGEIQIGGTVPLETLLTVDMTALRALYKISPEAVAKWPGVEIKEDIQIVSRGR